MKLVIKNLSKKYEFPVFENLNLIIDSNLNHLVGENGSGKSTLLNILSGNIKFDKGMIYLDDKRVSSNYLANNSVLINQDINLFVNKTVKENISLILGNNVDESLIEEFNFSNYLDKRVEELSGGYKKKLMILIALLIKPQILLLDEYSSYIDKESLDIINEKILDYSKDHFVIYIDHNDSLNGKMIDINQNEEIDDIKLPKINNKYKFKFSIKLFSLISMLILTLFISLSQSSITVYQTKKENIIENQIEKYDLWFAAMLNNDIDLDYEKYYMVNAYSDFVYYAFYTKDPNIPLSIKSDRVEENMCYVFSSNKDLYEKNIIINDKEYFVNGVIDLKIERYQKNTFEEEFNSVVIISDYVPEVYISIFLNVKEDSYKLFQEDLIYNGLDFFLENEAYKPISIVFIVSVIIFIFVYCFIDSYHKKEEIKVLSCYKNSLPNLYLNDIISMFIITIIFGILGILFAHFGVYLIYKKLIPRYSSIFVNSYLYVLIEMVSFYIIYIIIEYLVAYRKKKENN